MARAHFEDNPERIWHMPESLRLFQICSAMEWTHLPVAGGLYDQSYRLLDEWLVIFNVQGEVEKQKEKDRKAEAEKNKGKDGGGKKRRGRRR